MNLRKKPEVSYLLMRVVDRLSESVNQELKAWGLNLLSARVLVSVLAQDSVGVSSLASDAQIDQSTLSHMLRRLELAGLVRRRRLESDNRSVRVSLTSEGEVAAVQCLKTLDHHDRLLLKSLDDTSVTQAKNLLLQLLENTSCFDERARLLAIKREQARLEASQARV
jgi:DNA-binding MarR family transcriptional regulator